MQFSPDKHTCSRVDLPAIQPGPDHVPSSDKHTFPSYTEFSRLPIPSAWRDHSTHRIQVGVEAELAAICLSKEGSVITVALR